MMGTVIEVVVVVVLLIMMLIDFEGGRTALLQQTLLLLGAFLLEEQPNVVDGKDDALAGRLLGIDVHATHQHRVGAVEQGEDEQRDAMR